MLMSKNRKIGKFTTLLLGGTGKQISGPKHNKPEIRFPRFRFPGFPENSAEINGTRSLKNVNKKLKKPRRFRFASLSDSF